MSQIYGETFENGEGARIVAYVAPDNSLEQDFITVYGNYPIGEFGEVWARNEESKMIAAAIRGTGRIAIRQTVDGKTFLETMELQNGSAAHVPAGEWYAWQTDSGEGATSAVAFAPAFDKNKSRIATEEELQNEA